MDKERHLILLALFEKARFDDEAVDRDVIRSRKPEIFNLRVAQSLFVVRLRLQWGQRFSGWVEDVRSRRGDESTNSKQQLSLREELEIRD
jgi:hypothetical protein